MSATAAHFYFSFMCIGLKEIRSFQPDLIIAIGGGSPMDAAKVS